MGLILTENLPGETVANFLFRFHYFMRLRSKHKAGESRSRHSLMELTGKHQKIMMIFL